ncbi:unnamed protein product [Acanthoscelides obtectus]|uniref:Uncharacterized protein n=1 Tax=Acanthoscelides obtectus TaxID=200917 RepID=A0A9P0VTA0_ACAOB|nr:unnamed protein product [Acanthoscelides obtectus]CAK1688819.1 hypothetical protein AOBTE_LOCUS36898 [Acanthoscelides obtectus]
MDMNLTQDTNFMVLKDRIAKDLIELRNKSVFAFLMFNALFVLVVFLLQLNKDQIHVKWPLGVKTNITYIEETSEVFSLFVPARMHSLCLYLLP